MRISQRSPSAQRLADAEQQLRAVAGGQPVTEEGVAVPDGGAAAFLYRHEFLPDGRVRTVMVRLDAVGMPFPPPDRP
ncbi:hypothetical protein RMN57_01060 [Kitasatospora sp. CM 4170]|uniref:Uncharacterized protein n=1 Tax=Kitasatospora aburaviensis TaxID=67265 RepID=A0ABW1F9G5_9ACTN|nr:hypothetical protein [Kitasatospora sp. CM 4170]WNM43392.1 hypothetical protein RMN57_01060 [Kitasatospora sp. CM 4170]